MEEVHRPYLYRPHHRGNPFLQNRYHLYQKNLRQMSHPYLF